jgi:hypothetical protein
MRTFRIALIFVFGASVLAMPQAQYRQQYVGIYGIVERVELEPDARSPQRIRIQGVFTVPVPQSSFGRQPPRKGLLYFALVPERAASILRDWNALRAVAGTGQGVGFAHYWVDGTGPGGNPHTALVVTLHSDAATDAAPEPYPVGLLDGVVKMDIHDNEPMILAQLQQLSR